MSDKITAVNQVAAVATGNTVKPICILSIFNVNLIGSFGGIICRTHHTLVSTPYQSLQVFGSRLYQQLKDEPGNIIMSPFSVSGVMAMVGFLSHFWQHNTNEYRWLLGPVEIHCLRCSRVCHSQGSYSTI